MSLIERLRSAGARLGLVQMSPAHVPGEPPKVVTKVVTLNDLRPGIRQEQVAALVPEQVKEPVDLTLPFVAIDEAAGIRNSAHGWTAETVVARLRRQDIAGYTRDQVQAIMVAELAAAGAPVEDVARDAIARDQAIDAFAASAHRIMVMQAHERRRCRSEMLASIEQLQRHVTELEAYDHKERMRWKAWWATKLAREQALAQALGILLEQDIITVDEQPPPLD